MVQNQREGEKVSYVRVDCVGVDDYVGVDCGKVDYVGVGYVGAGYVGADYMGVDYVGADYVGAGYVGVDHAKVDDYVGVDRGKVEIEFLTFDAMMNRSSMVGPCLVLVDLVPVCGASFAGGTTVQPASPKFHAGPTTVRLTSVYFQPREKGVRRGVIR